MIERDIAPSGPCFLTHTETLDYRTSDALQFIDITDDVVDAVNRSQVISGIATAFSRHTTAAIKINECEPELIKDMQRFLAEIAPMEREYYHNNFDVRTVNMEEDECPNAHAHCQHIVLSSSETVPVINGRLHLGRWQRVFLIELDRAKARQVTVQIIGV